MKKQELNLILSMINKTYNDFDLFIETGSYVGETIDDMINLFKEIISIEITDKYANYCKNKFIYNENVRIIKGDSLNVLPELIKLNDKKNILFYLDGHYSAGDTGKNNLDCPLLQELNIINNNLKNSCLIIIDDADLFEYEDHLISWKGINENNIIEQVKDRVKNYFYVQNTVKALEKTRFVIELNYLQI